MWRTLYFINFHDFSRLVNHVFKTVWYCETGLKFVCVLHQTPNSLLNGLTAVLHQEPDGGGCRVELGHLIFINNLPHSAHIRVCGKTLKLGTEDLKKSHSKAYTDKSKCLKSDYKRAKSDLSGCSPHQHTGRTIGQGPVCDVWVTGDPTNVRSAPVHIIRVIIKHHLKGGRSVEHVPTHCVQHTLEDK